MRRRVLICTALLILATSIAHAAPGVNLRWTNCLGDAGAFNRNFACNTNSGSNVLVGSFVLGQPRAQISGTQMVIDVVTTSPSIPSWWALLNVGNCRQTAMSISSIISPTAVNCVDWAADQASAGITSYTIGVHGPSTARIIMTSSVPPADVQDLFENEEYFAFNLTVSNIKTVGTPVCNGCNVPACLGLGSIKLSSPLPANDNVVLSGPTNGTDSNLVTWQSGSSSCMAATPTKQQTWGAVKALYR
jgi:hypothetical protein